MFDEADAIYLKVQQTSLQVDKKLQKSTIAHRNQSLVAWIMLSDSRLLAEQILAALKRRDLLIALIALRAFFEGYINAIYVFHNFEKKDNPEWIGDVCKDFIERANDHTKRKSYLNGESVAVRSKLLPDSYQRMYVPICNFTHMLGYSPNHKNPDRFEWFTRNACIFVLQGLHSICNIIQLHFGIDEALDCKEAVDKFEKKYSDEATGRFPKEDVVK